MTTRQNIKTPAPDTIAYLAGEHIFKAGPITREQLFVAVDFGGLPSRRSEALQRVLDSGWLIPTLYGKLACCTEAVDFYDGAYDDQGAVKTVGQMAAPRQQSNLFTRPALSKKYLTNSNGSRPDIPTWSTPPADFCFKGIAGGEV